MNERDLFLNCDLGEILGSCDNHAPVRLHRLESADDGEMLVAGTGRRVDDQIIELAPKRVLHKLSDERFHLVVFSSCQSSVSLFVEILFDIPLSLTLLSRSTVNNGCVAISEEESGRHDLECWEIGCSLTQKKSDLDHSIAPKERSKV